MQAIPDQTPREKIKAIITELGLTVQSEFVPFSKSRHAKLGDNGKVWRSLNWRVTLSKRLLVWREDNPTALHTILTTDYSEGVAHCPASKAPVKSLGHADSMLRSDAIDHEIETGTRYAAAFGGMTGKLPPPDAVDVIYSLVQASDVIDYSTFEEWAENLGYDADSRKAEATYRACLEIALKLRNAIGDSNLQRLREACQDF